MALVANPSKITRSFFLVLFLLLLVPPSFYHQPEAGIDGSWNIALHLAYKYNLVFGKDFVFTYGPLGILNSRHPIAINLFVYLIFDIYLLASIFFALRQIFKKNFGPWIVLFTFFTFVLLIPGSPDEWCFILIVFHLLFFIKEPHMRWSLFQAALLSIISFYIKVSSGVIGIVLILAGLGYSTMRKKITLTFLITFAIAYITILWLSARMLHVDLTGYTVTSLKLINDYNDAMFITLNQRYAIYLYAALFLMAMVFFWIIYKVALSFSKKNLLKNVDDFFVYAILGLSMFIYFKSGFVRSEDHFHIFFKGATVLAAFIYVFTPTPEEKRIPAIICWITLIVSSIAISAISGSYQLYVKVADLRLFQEKAFEIKRYVGQILYYNEARAASDKLDTSNNGLKRIIGNGTVDIIPFEISKIYFNGLRYNPRPVIQSYAAYDRYLDSLNYQKYMAEDAPDYVLFTVGGIDARYAFFDEEKTKLALFNRYRIIGEAGKDLILQKRPINYKALIPGNKTSLKVKFGEDIPIKNTMDLQYAQINVEYSLWGKIMRFFYQPPTLPITFIFNSGDTRTIKGIKSVLGDQVIVNKYVESTPDFQLLMQSSGRISANIKSIRFGTDGKHSGFKDNITMVITHFPFREKSAEELQADSLSIVKVQNEYKLFSFDTSTFKQGIIKYDIKNFNTYTPLIQLNAWAFREDGSNKNAVITTVLQSKDRAYGMPTVQMPQVDVAQYFKRDDVTESGFVSIASKAEMDPGDYRVGIAVTYKDSTTTWITFINQHFLVRSNYSVEKLKSIEAASGNNDELQYYIGGIEERKDEAIIDGWAFIKNSDTRRSKTSLVLKGRGGIFRVNTDVIATADLISHFKDTRLGYGGFTSIIPKDQLPEDTYLIGIEVNCHDGKAPLLRFSDKSITVSAP
jgi:hypothetical protein